MCWSGGRSTIKNYLFLHAYSQHVVNLKSNKDGVVNQNSNMCFCDHKEQYGEAFHQKILHDRFDMNRWGGSVVYGLDCSPSTSEVTGSKLGPGTSCWKVVSYLPMPSGLQCRILTN